MQENKRGALGAKAAKTTGCPVACLSQKEQKASQDGRYLQRACGPRVSVRLISCGNLQRVSGLAEIQEAIEKLAPEERSALARLA
jgi:hypothetical protein